MSSHMRRALAACTSPEVFFGSGVSGIAGDSIMNNNLPISDALGMAMEALDLTLD